MPGRRGQVVRAAGSRRSGGLDLLPLCPGWTLHSTNFGTVYLLEHLGFAAKTPALKKYVREHAKQLAMLLPKAPEKRSHRNKGWKLYVNADVKAEL